MTTPLVVALTSMESAAFFPDAEGQELRALAGPAGLFDPSEPGADWSGFLALRRPEVIVSHWSTPSLPETALDHLRYLAHTTGTVRHLIPRAFLERGVRVTNWGNSAAEPVAESTLMLILAALRETQHWGRELHERARWKENYGGGRTLFDHRVAIHGFGRIARALILLLKPFRVKVQAYSQGVPDDFIRQHGAEPVPSLEALFSSGADVVVELEALNAMTAGSVHEAHLRAIPPGSVFVNSGRGAIVDERALERIAIEGRLRLALDVFAVDPLPTNSPLRGLPNVTLMPHVGGPTPDLYPACGRLVLDNLQRWRRGEPLASELTLQGYDLST